MRDIIIVCGQMNEQLVDWSGALGSDITFFLSRGTAYCTGRGEIMTPVAPMEDGTKLCIVKPDIGLSTPSVFKALKYDCLSTVDPEELLNRFMEYGVDANGPDAYVNDLEQPAFDCVPELKELKEELQEVSGFRHVMMSGSGTSIFCIGEPDDMDGFMQKFGEREGLNVFATEFTSREEGKWFQPPNQTFSTNAIKYMSTYIIFNLFDELLKQLRTFILGLVFYRRQQSYVYQYSNDSIRVQIYTTKIRSKRWKRCQVPYLITYLSTGTDTLRKTTITK